MNLSLAIGITGLEEKKVEDGSHSDSLLLDNVKKNPNWSTYAGKEDQEQKNQTPDATVKG